VAVLAADLTRRRVGPAEHDRDLELPRAHLEILAALLMIWSNATKREVPGHELDDRPEARHRGADADALRSRSRDGRVDDALGTELLEQPSVTL
jgi:hypothetical protein